MFLHFLLLNLAGIFSAVFGLSLNDRRPVDSLRHRERRTWWYHHQNVKSWRKGEANISWALLIVFPNDPFLRYMPTRSTSFLSIDSGDILTRCSRIRNLATIDREWGFILVFMRRGRISAPNTPTTSSLDNCSPRRTIWVTLSTRRTFRS
jgi:hypothetical protein